MTPFNFTIAKRAREGIYHVRLYSFPGAGVSGSTNTLDNHFGWLALYAPEVKLPPDTLKSLGAFDVECENEFAQGNPRLTELTIELASIPQLVTLFKAARSGAALNAWIEVTLEQPVLDAPSAGHQAANRGSAYPMVWPMKTRNLFWGQLDFKTLKGKVFAQRVKSTTTNDYVQAERTHNGNISMSFIHWMKLRGAGSVKTFLDGFSAASGTFSYVPFSTLLLQLFENFSPTNTLWVSDQAMFGELSSYFVNFILPFETSIDGITWTNKFQDQYIGSGTSNALFHYDPNSVPSTSLYHWKNFAEAITACCNEFFLYPQLEIPTMAAAMKDNSVDSVTRLLLLQQLGSDVPLPIFIDPEEDTIEYDPCAVYASSYKVDEPSGPDLTPDPPSQTASSGFIGGADQSYTTLLRLCGQSFKNAVPADDARGWELYNPDGHGGYAFVRHIRFNGIIFDDWAAFHAYARIFQWGSIRGMITLRSRGVGIEPYGYSAKQYKYLSGVPKLTYGLRDYAEFPLYRKIKLQPGLLSNPDNDNPTTFITIGVKRTPDGETDLKLLELAPYGVGASIAARNPPPAPPPPHGPPDPPTTNVPSPTPASTLSGVKPITVTAINAFGVAQVSVQIDGLILDTQVASRNAGTWTFSWDTTKWANGAHTIKAIAYDLGGNTSVVIVPVTVSN